MIRRLGVIGDLHGEHQRLERLLDWFAGQAVDALVCTGDVADGRGCLNRSCDLLREGDVHTVAGNHDRWLLNDRVRHLENAHDVRDLTDDNLEYLQALPRWMGLETMAGRLMLCHGVADRDLERVWPGRNPDEIRRSAALDEIIDQREFRFLINGHMHFRMLVDFEHLTLMNAGTLMGPYAGVSIIDFQQDSVTVFSVSDGNAPERQLERTLSPGEERPVWRSTAEFDGTRTPITLYPARA
jgi:predicted phosphodiesterase